MSLTVFGQQIFPHLSQVPCHTDLSDYWIKKITSICLLSATSPPNSY